MSVIGRKNMLWLIAAIVLVSVVVPVVLRRMGEARRRAAAVKMKAFRLRQAREALSKLTDGNLDSLGPSYVGKSGMILKYEDGSWVAIRCGEPNAQSGWSGAVARDSLGRSYESEENFSDAIPDFRRAMSGVDSKSAPPIVILQSNFSKEMISRYAAGPLAPLITCSSALELEEGLFAIGFAKAQGQKPAERGG